MWGTNTTLERHDEETTIAENWEYYESTSKNIALWHPPESSISYEAEQLKVTMVGPESHMTEITDGFTFFVRTQDLDNQELSTTTWQEFEQQTEILEPISEPQSGRFSGYEFKIKGGLGNEITYLLFTRENTTFITSYFIADPQQVGYEGQITDILNNLTVIE